MERLHAGRVREALTVLAGALAMIALALPADALADNPPFFYEGCKTTGSTGECDKNLRGIASAPETAPVADVGHVFVADLEGARLLEFTPWGRFVRTWGWDVVKEGPGDTVANGFEVCVPADGDVCKAGKQEAGGAGGFSVPVGVAVDSAGGVYVYDAVARRVQKFAPGGGFAWAAGKNVNKAKFEELGGPYSQAEKNLCLAGEECRSGESGAGPGEFSIEELGDHIDAYTAGTASTADDRIYVGDVDRIQRYDASGQVEAAGEIATPETVQSLAVGPAGNLYVAYLDSEGLLNEDKPNVRELDPESGAPVGPEEFPVANPRAVAVAPDGDVYAFDKDGKKILHFDSGGAEVAEPFGERLGGESLSSGSTGLGTGAACFEAAPGYDLYFSNASPPFFNAYGPHPDRHTGEGEGCEPPKAPPEIADQIAASVEYEGASVRAKINPRFWADTTYYVEYGAGRCSEGGCPNDRPVPPGVTLTSGVTDEALATGAIALPGLAPDTTYHFRFVAESSGGGPVYGIDPDGEGPGEASFEEGLEGEFHTFAVAGPPAPCANDAFRGGPGARLPDCRAYEMVSPVDKNGGDVTPYFYEGLDPSAAAPRCSTRAPPAARSSPTSPQPPSASRNRAPSSASISRRVGRRGWSSESIDPPERGGSQWQQVGRAASRGPYTGCSRPTCATASWSPNRRWRWRPARRRGSTASTGVTARMAVSPAFAASAPNPGAN